ncbi:molecular chaperone GrpE [Scopulibacillus daqui]|uniref:Protein GrpE n=1 Tax=Scopulibacillus daqui TaxID=1469162 RepID=A0ABS2Q0H8_9BACL|nr:nucleotide exchange factor GrpE [Scopulibacillus daqui]MBM7645811.1 molecular chaperone GrpE [Scopulibacillus daqui]
MTKFKAKEKEKNLEHEQEEQAEELNHENQDNEQLDNKETADSNSAEEEHTEQTEDNEADILKVKEEEIEQFKKEQEELKNRLLRVQADYENYKRRTNEEKIKERKFRAQSLVEEILPVLDNFKRALDVKTESEEAGSLKKGMEMVYRQLTAALEKEGVKEIEAVGKPFDPHMHQAVMQVEHDEYDENTVVEVLQAGFTLNDRVVRPAMVKVSS